MQVAFETDADSPAVQAISVLGSHYSVYVHSFLGYGHNEVEELALQELRRRQVATSPSVHHPCYPRGYQTGAEGSGKPVIGTSDFLGCTRLLQTLLYPPNCPQTAEGCSLAEIPRPDTPQQVRVRECVHVAEGGQLHGSV